MRFLFVAALVAALSAPAQIITVDRAAGLPDSDQPGRLLQDFIPATSTTLCEPWSLVAAPSGVLYVAEGCRGVVRAVWPNGRITTVAGGGSDGLGGPARLAFLGERLSGVDLGPDGSLYVAALNGFIYRIDPSGRIETHWIVEQSAVWDIAVDGRGVVYAAVNTGILAFDPQQGERLLVGSRRFDQGAPLFGVFGLEAAPDGDVYFAERNTHLIHRAAPDGSLHSVAGVRGVGEDAGDGGPASAASFASPFDVTLADDGSLYVTTPDRVRRISSEGVVSTVAGGGRRPAPLTPYWGDGGPATEAGLSDPRSVAVGPDGAVYIAERSIGRVRRVDPATGALTTVAGSFRFTGDGRVAAATAVGQPSRVAFDSAGAAYFADAQNHRIRRIRPDGSIETVAGLGESGYSGDGGPAIDARFSFPQSVAVDSLDRVWVADSGNNRIRRIAGGIVVTVAGDGTYAYRGDGFPAPLAWLAAPQAVEFDQEGRLLIADTDNHRVRRINSDGTIETVAGNGQVGTEGDGGPATQAQLIIPTSLAVADDGSLYIADRGALAVRRVGADGVISTAVRSQPSGPFQGPFASLFGVAAAPGRGVWVSVDSSIRLLGLNGGSVDYEIRDRRSTFRPGALASNAAPAAGPDGRLWLSGTTGIYRERRPSDPPVPVLGINGFGIGSRAGFLPGAPGAIVQLFGESLGPAEPTLAAFDSAGRLPLELAGTRVLVDGSPAPLLFSVDGQVNAVLPFNFTPDVPHALAVEYQGRLSNDLRIGGFANVPAVFTTRDGAAAAINQDGRINALGSPAGRDTVVALYVTGAGAMQTALADGQVASGPLVRTAAQVRATVAGIEAEVLYAGNAPGLVHGAVQVNVRIPAETPAGERPVVVWIDGVPSQTASLFLQ